MGSESRLLNGIVNRSKNDDLYGEESVKIVVQFVVTFGTAYRIVRMVETRFGEGENRTGY